ncbi:MAG: hypothetical protein IT378_07665 [Sandaracinaceae bacterium]|nr:hypothetical protein [Sandaracinaceae bacterium]
MTRIAILDELLPAQIAEAADELEGLEIVWQGSSWSELRRRLPDLDANVVVVAMDRIDDDPRAALAQLEGKPAVELVIVLYDFARRELLRGLEGPSRRIVRAPITLGRLRMQMMSLVVRDALGAPRSPAPTRRPTARPALAAPRPSPSPSPASITDVAAPRFTEEQLGRLMERVTAIECECPNHLSQLVHSLRAFEQYSARCENKDDADAAIHRMLHLETARARAVLEEALVKLVEHERIAL